MKRVLLSFSAGIDSTYLMWKNLEEGNIVTPIYLYLHNIENKSNIESNQIDKLLDLFKINYPNQVDDLLTTNLTIGRDKSHNFAPRRRSIHMPIWILTLLYAQDTEKHDEIQMGIIKNDDIIPDIIPPEDIHENGYVSYLTHMVNIYESYAPVCYDLVPLIFPLVDVAKVDIIAMLPDEYFNLTVSCENPIDDDIVKYCGKCSPCKRLLTLKNDKLNKRFINKN
jgi:7-cyano-7-deazaguanine synthase in queuosine biosynthesis